MGIIAYADSIADVEAIPSGLFIDKLTGIGGIPRGVITEIFGDESIGKSSVCLQLVAAAQQQGLKCLWADIEWSYTPRYAASLGVDNSKLGLIREEIAEDSLDLVEEAIRSGEWDLVIIDSIGGLLPRDEAEKNADAKTIGGQAKLVARFCRKVVPLIRINNIALVVINHALIDIMSGKLKTSGGKKLAYHKSLSIRLKAKQGVSVKQGDRKTGKVVIGEVRKNKEAPTEGMELEGTLIFGTGFSAASDLMDAAIEKGIITKKGNTYWLGSEKLGLGLGRTRKVIEDDAMIQEKIKSLMV